MASKSDKCFLKILSTFSKSPVPSSTPPLASLNAVFILANTFRVFETLVFVENNISWLNSFVFSASDWRYASSKSSLKKSAGSTMSTTSLFSELLL